MPLRVRASNLTPIVLTIDEKETLEAWCRRPKTAQALALRARIVLLCATGKANTAVAAETQVDRVTVGKWRARFLAKRLDGLLDEPRPGAPRQIRIATSSVSLRRRSNRSRETRPTGAPVRSPQRRE